MKIKWKEKYIKRKKERTERNDEYTESRRIEIEMTKRVRVKVEIEGEVITRTK